MSYLEDDRAENEKATIRSDVPDDYLGWIVDRSDLGEDVKFTGDIGNTGQVGFSAFLSEKGCNPTAGRTSWAGADLQCTGRNQPIRSSCAMPRASLRSVLTIIAESAAFTCLVSSSTASNPALTRAAWSHCDKGPAWASRRGVGSQSGSSRR